MARSTDILSTRMRRNWITESTDSKTNRGEATAIERTCFEGKLKKMLIFLTKIATILLCLVLYSMCPLKVSSNETRTLKSVVSSHQLIQPYICHLLLLIQIRKLTLTATYRMISKYFFVFNWTGILRINVLFAGANTCSSSMTNLKYKMILRYWKGWDYYWVSKGSFSCAMLDWKTFDNF